jgi:hypothetical protein
MQAKTDAINARDKVLAWLDTLDALDGSSSLNTDSDVLRDMLNSTSRPSSPLDLDRVTKPILHPPSSPLLLHPPSSHACTSRPTSRRSDDTPVLVVSLFEEPPQLDEHQDYMQQEVPSVRGRHKWRWRPRPKCGSAVMLLGFDFGSRHWPKWLGAVCCRLLHIPRVDSNAHWFFGSVALSNIAGIA